MVPVLGLVLLTGLTWLAGSTLAGLTEQNVPVSASGLAEILTRQHTTASGDRFVSGTAVVAADRTSRGWRIVVAAEQLSLVPEGYIRDGVHYYEWGLAPDGADWMVIAGPAEVAGPAEGMFEGLDLPLPDASPTTVAVENYLTWLLTGADGTYSGARPTPSPYESIDITGLRLNSITPEEAIATVAVVAVDRYGHGADLSYHLTLEKHRDIWIVATD